MLPLKVTRIDPFRLKIEQRSPMLTHGIVYANHAIEEAMDGLDCMQQVANVACLPGIVGPSIAMPDIHWGYGFPIGGVAAFDCDEGIISPGGVGYDINCGIRCIKTNLVMKEIRSRIPGLIAALFNNVPAGVGVKNKAFTVGKKEFFKVLTKGAAWVVNNGLGDEDDLEAHEESGTFKGADPDMVSMRAVERGLPQLGTLGSGNHFVEIDYVEEVFDKVIAQRFGLFPDQAVVMVHTGSRGLGHQVCDDYVHSMMKTDLPGGIELQDRQLVCAPFSSRQGRSYMCAMAAAANFAFANRELITMFIRQTFERVFGSSYEHLGMKLLYDCCHNIAKKESMARHGDNIEVCVHRKGATRALPPGDSRLPERFRDTGQPVIVPGDMGRASYILAGSDKAKMTFYSACHGAGRLLSRNQAKKISKGRSIIEEFCREDIHVMAASRATLNEEIPDAYKDVTDVVDTIAGVGIARSIARLRPVAIIKG